MTRHTILFTVAIGVLTLVPLSGAPPSGPNALETDQVIMPGTGVAGVRIGERMRPTKEYAKLGLEVGNHSGAKLVDFIIVKNPKYVTKDGLRVGSTLAMVQKIYPNGVLFDPEDDYAVGYDKYMAVKDFSYYFTKGKVSSIFISSLGG